MELALKALAIVGVIACSWISGLCASDSGNKAAVSCAAIFLLLALICGWLAWRIA